MTKTSVTLEFTSIEAMIAYFAGKPATPAMSVTTSNDDDDETPNTAAPDLDKNGLPWDERIHAPSKAINKDGSWRGKKGAGADLIEQVTAELKAQQNITNTPDDRQPPSMPQTQPAQQMPPIPNAPPQMPSMPQTQPAQQMPPMPDQQPAPQMPSMPQTQPAQQEAPQNAQQAFQNFMNGLQPQMQQGHVDANYLATLTKEVATAWNIPLSAITDIANNMQMIEYTIQCMRRDGKWVQ